MEQKVRKWVFGDKDPALSHSSERQSQGQAKSGSDLSPNATSKPLPVGMKAPVVENADANLASATSNLSIATPREFVGHILVHFV